jgi:GTP cyclohydrolase I
MRKAKWIDKKKIEKGVRLILEGIGEDLAREGLKKTPKRVADFFEEIFINKFDNPTAELKLYSAPNSGEMVIAKKIPFYSFCEHHLLPFFGLVHIAYIPGKKIIGFTRLSRLVEILASRPQLQERYTGEIADILMQGLKPKGVLVIIEAEHLCLSMRGIKRPGSLTVTSAIRGSLKKDPHRTEAFALIR